MIMVSFLQRNTFQCVIATDGSTSFALFLYDTLQWSEANPAHVGFNNGMFIVSKMFKMANIALA